MPSGKPPARIIEPGWMIPGTQSLAFKQMGSTGVWSVRVGIGWRALGLVDDDTITWFWIGSHADYDTFVKSLR